MTKIEDDFFETKEEKQKTTDLQNEINSLLDKVPAINPDLRDGFKGIINELSELMVISQAQNISPEKTKSNIAAVTILLKQINSLGLGIKNKSVEEAGIARKEHFKNPSGHKAIKATFEQVEGLIEK